MEIEQISQNAPVPVPETVTVPIVTQDATLLREMLIGLREFIAELYRSDYSLTWPEERGILIPKLSFTVHEILGIFSSDHAYNEFVKRHKNIPIKYLRIYGVFVNINCNQTEMVKRLWNKNLSNIRQYVYRKAQILSARRDNADIVTLENLEEDYQGKLIVVSNPKDLIPVTLGEQNFYSYEEAKQLLLSSMCDDVKFRHWVPVFGRHIKCRECTGRMLLYRCVFVVGKIFDMCIICLHKDPLFYDQIRQQQVFRIMTQGAIQRREHPLLLKQLQTEEPKLWSEMLLEMNPYDSRPSQFVAQMGRPKEAEHVFLCMYPNCNPKKGSTYYIKTDQDKTPHYGTYHSTSCKKHILTHYDKQITHDSKVSRSLVDYYQKFGAECEEFVNKYQKKYYILLLEQISKKQLLEQYKLISTNIISVPVPKEFKDLAFTTYVWTHDKENQYYCKYEGCNDCLGVWKNVNIENQIVRMNVSPNRSAVIAHILAKHLLSFVWEGYFEKIVDSVTNAVAMPNATQDLVYKKLGVVYAEQIISEDMDESDSSDEEEQEDEPQFKAQMFGAKLAIEAETQKYVDTVVDKITKKTDKVTNTIESMTGKLEDLVEEIQEKATTFAPDITMFRQSANNFVSEFKKLVELLEYHKSELKNKVVMVVERLVGLALTAHVISKINDTKLAVEVALIWISSSGIISSCHSFIVDYLLKASAKSLQMDDLEEEDFVAQSGENVFFGMVKVVASAFGFQGIDEMKKNSIRAKTFSTYVHAFKDIPNLFRMIKDAVEYVICWMFGLPFEGDAETSLLIEEIEVFVKKVQVEFPEDLVMKVWSNQLTSKAIEKYYLEGLRLNERLIKTTLTAQITVTFKGVFEALRKAYEQVINLKRSDKGKRKPLALWLYSKPGQGKTMLTALLGVDLFRYFNPKIKFEKNRHAYDRNVSAEFYDGYKQQFVFLIDDAWQLDNTETNSKIGADLIHIINDGSHQLNMASIEEKTGTFFGSPFVLLTSNDRDVPTTCKISDNQALRRRFELFIEVKVDSRVLTNEVVDAEKVKQFYPDDLGRGMYKFLAYYQNGAPVHHEMDYIDLFNHCKNIMQDRLNIGKSFWEEVAEDNFIDQFDTSDDSFETLTDATNDSFMYVIESDSPDYRPSWASDMSEEERRQAANESETDDENVSGGELRQRKKDKILNAQMKKGFLNEQKYPKKQKSKFRKVPLDDVPAEPVEFIHPAPKPYKAYESTLFQETIPQETPVRDSIYKMVEKKILSYIVKTRDLAIPTCRIDRWGALHSDYTPLKEMYAQMSKIYSGGVVSAKTALANHLERVKASPMYKVAATVAAALGIAGACFAIYSFVKGDKINFEAHAPNPSGDAITKKMRVQRHAKLKSHKEGAHKLNEFYGQMKDPQAHDLALSLIPNIVEMMWCSEDDTGGRLNMLMLKERTGLTVQHFLYGRKDTENFIRIRTTKGVFKIPLEDIEYEIIAGTDIMMLTFLNTQLPMFKDITHSIISEKDLTGNFSELGRIKPLPRDLGIEFSIGHAEHITPKKYRFEDVDMSVERCIPVHVPNEDGDCAAPYVVYNPKMQKKIVGLHVAGDGRTALCHVITREMLGLDNEIKAQMRMENQITFDSRYFEEIGILPDAPQIPSKTELKPSIVQQYEKSKVDAGQERTWPEPITKPAHLRPFTTAEGDRKSPAQISLNKFEKIDFKPSAEDSELFDECVGLIVNMLPNLYKCRKLTKHEALNGVPEWTHTARIHRNTSRGMYRYKDKNVPSGKTAYILNLGTDAQPLFALSELLEKDVDMYIELAEKGQRLYVLWMDCMKDERRPNEKVDLGKTRLFSAGSLEHFIVNRIYLQSFVENMMSDPVNSPSCLGINVHSLQWKFLYERLNRFGDQTRCWPGDFDGYDASINEWLNKMYRKVLRAYMETYNDLQHELYFTEKDFQIIDIIHDNSYDAYHVLLGKIYRTLVPGSNPSGNLETTVYNIVVNIFVHILAAVRTAREKGVPSVTGRQQYSPSDYLVQFELTAFGDDHIESSNVKWYTMADKARWITYYGLRYTDQDKRKDFSKEYYTLDEVVYLKRRFRVVGNMVFAPLPKENIYEIVNWIRQNNVDEKLATTVNAEASLREMFHWGREEYESYHNKLNLELLRAGCPPMRYVSWQELFIEFSGQGFSYEYTFNAQMNRGDESDQVPISADKVLLCKYKDNEMQVQTYRRRRSKYVKTNTATRHYKLQYQTPGYCAQMSDAPTPVIQNVEQAESTTFVDETPVEHTEDTVLSSITAIPATMTTNPSVALLRRPYLLDNVRWSGTYTQGAVLRSWTFPYDLYNNWAMFKHAINPFKYFRIGSMKVSFRMNSTSFNSGMLMFRWSHGRVYVPSSAFTSYSAGMQTAIRSTERHVLMDASTKEVIEVVLPFVHPKPFNTINNYNTGYSLDTFDKGSNGWCELSVLDPLVLLGSTATPYVDISVTVELLDLELFGPNGSPNITTTSTTKFRAQMKKELQQKDKFKLMSGTFDALSQISAVVKVFPGTSVVGGISGPIFSYVSKVLKQYGYSKPTTQQAFQRVIQMDHSTLSHGDGLDNSLKLSLLPDARVANTFTLYDNRDDDLLANFVLRPAIVTNFAILPSNTSNTIVKFIPCDPCYTDYTDNIPTGSHSKALNAVNFTTLTHAKWRGGMKYMFLFSCSPRVTARVRIVFVPGPYNSSQRLPTVQEFGDYYSTMIDITGTTKYCFTIPYMIATPLQYANRLDVDPSGLGALGSLFVVVENAPVTYDSANDSNISVFVYASGAEDFVVTQPFRRNDTTIVPMPQFFADVEYKAQMFTTKNMPLEIFQEPFPPLHPDMNTVVDNRLAACDYSSRWTQILNRSNFVKNVTNNGSFNFRMYLTDAFTGGADKMVRAITSIFAWYRGSIRYKIFCSGEATNSGATSTPILGAVLTDPNIDGSTAPNFGNVAFYNGAEMVDIGKKSFLEIEMPHRETVYMKNRLETTNNAMDVYFTRRDTATNSVTLTVLGSLGEDFSMGSVLPLGTVTYSNTTTDIEDFAIVSNNNNKNEKNLARFKAQMFGQGATVVGGIRRKASHYKARLDTMFQKEVKISPYVQTERMVMQNIDPTANVDDINQRYGAFFLAQDRNKRKDLFFTLFFIFCLFSAHVLSAYTGLDVTMFIRLFFIGFCQMICWSATHTTVYMRISTLFLIGAVPLGTLLLGHWFFGLYSLFCAYHASKFITNNINSLHDEYFQGTGRFLNISDFSLLNLLFYLRGAVQYTLITGASIALSAVSLTTANLWDKLNWPTVASVGKTVLSSVASLLTKIHL